MLVGQKTDSIFRYNLFQMRFHFVGIAIISYSTRHEQLFYSIFAYAFECFSNGLLTRYRKCRVVHAHGMPGTFSPTPRVRDPYMHHGTRATHVPWCMPGSLTSVFLLSQWRGKRSRHSRRMRKPQFYVSDKRPIEENFTGLYMYIHHRICRSLPQNAWKY